MKVGRKGESTLTGKETITSWYRAHSDAIFKYIFLIVRDAKEAEDLTQETFIKAYLNFDSFQHRANEKLVISDRSQRHDRLFTETEAARIRKGNIHFKKPSAAIGRRDRHNERTDRRVHPNARYAEAFVSASDHLAKSPRFFNAGDDGNFELVGK